MRGAVRGLAVLAAGSMASLTLASGAMPIAQQNAIVQKYCGVCHDDAHHNGGLSLEHFDAANPDPGVAAMLVSKMKTGAMGASGTPVPEQATVDALIRALSEKAVDAGRWSVNSAQDPATGMLTASIVREVPSTAKGAPVPDFYRLTLTCRLDTREGEMQLAWSPGEVQQGRVISVAADGSAPLTYTVTGHESMGNGNKGESGPGSIRLSRPELPLPSQSLTVSNAFPDETVVFPFAEMDHATRDRLATCFGRGAGNPARSRL